jgi:hypothetical protein
MLPGYAISGVEVEVENGRVKETEVCVMRDRRCVIPFILGSEKFGALSKPGRICLSFINLHQASQGTSTIRLLPNERKPSRA